MSQYHAVVDAIRQKASDTWQRAVAYITTKRTARSRTAHELLENDEEHAALAAALPEMLNRIAADPQGVGEPLAADDPEGNEVYQQFRRGQCFAVELSECEGEPAEYVKPPRSDGGFSVTMRCCPAHFDALGLGDQGFVRQ